MAGQCSFVLFPWKHRKQSSTNTTFVTSELLVTLKDSKKLGISHGQTKLSLKKKTAEIRRAEKQDRKSVAVHFLRLPLGQLLLVA